VVEEWTPPRDLRVVELAQDTCLDGRALLGRQGRKLVEHARMRALAQGVSLDALELVVVELEPGHAHAAIARLDGAAPREVAELAVDDAVEPADRRPARRIEAPAAVERRGKRLGGEIGGDLRVAAAAPEVRRQRPYVTAVEEREGVGLLAGGLEGLSQRGLCRLDLESVGGVVDDWRSWRCRRGSRSMTSCGPRSSR
jgi:hypothetical protein